MSQRDKFALPAYARVAEREGGREGGGLRLTSPRANVPLGYAPTINDDKPIRST